MDLFAVSYALLWIVVATLLISQFVVYRYLGQQLRNAPERKQTQGPALGAPLPGAALRSLDGARLEIGGARARPVLLFFASTTCEPCRKVRPFLGNFAERHRDVDTLLICRGRTDGDVAAFATGLPESVRVVPDRGWNFATEMRVSHTPFCIVADRASLVRGKGSPDGDLAFEWFKQQLDVVAGKIPPSIELTPVAPRGA